jgi:aerobic-type carbon monoxide dehydrogenase small subunit (CoxS/CutS family)
MEKRSLNFRVNGIQRTLTIAPHRTLLQVLREDLKLTGAKLGCGIGECGACTVLMNGEPVNACLVMAIKAAGKEVLTIEGLGSQENVHPIQKAFIEQGAVHCGFCTPGMILSAKALLDRSPHPSTLEIKEALGGNLCRCTGYHQIIAAIEAVEKE